MDDQTADMFPRPAPAGALTALNPAGAAARPWRVPFVAGAVYAASTVVALALGVTAGATTPVSSSSAGVLVGGLALTILVACGEPVRRAATLWAWLLTAFAGLSLVLLATARLPVRPYGDGAMFAELVGQGLVVPRWLIGSAAATAGHAALWEPLPVRSVLPVTMHSATAFLAIAGTLTMVLGTWGLFRRWPDRLSVLLPALTPVWLLFGSGYVEYYPLIAVPFVAVLAWLFERPLEERTPLEIGVVGGLLPLLYIGFVPTALCVLAAYVVVRRDAGWRTAAFTVAVAAVAIAACWPEGATSYFRTLYTVMNFGDAHLPARYAGQVAGPASLVFALAAVRSWARAREVLYLLVWGGGWWALPLLVVAAREAWKVMRSDRPRTWRDARPWLGAALVGWHLYYVVFMVPRLGPTADIDLFFPTYLLLAFMAGLLLDTAHNHRASPWRMAAIACALATLACAGPSLVWFGLPAVP